jgi:hypothetical protein
VVRSLCPVGLNIPMTCDPSKNPYNATCSHISPCEGELPPMGGAVVPEGIEAVPVFVGNEVEWELDPAQPQNALPTLLVNQSGGGILIEDDIYLAIE